MPTRSSIPLSSALEELDTVIRALIPDTDVETLIAGMQLDENSDAIGCEED